MDVKYVRCNFAMVRYYQKRKFRNENPHTLLSYDHYNYAGDFL